MGSRRDGAGEGLLDGLALLLLDAFLDLEAVLLWDAFAFLDGAVRAHLAGDGDAAGDQGLDVGVLANSARHLAALLGVHVLLDLLGLLTLFQLAHFLLLVVTDLFLGRKWNALIQLLADLFPHGLRTSGT